MRQPFVGAGAVWRGRGVWRRYAIGTGKAPGGRKPHNLLRNSAGAGAVVGAPGTLPTNWAANNPADGLSREIVGFGVDSATNLPFVDVRWSGTSSAAGNTTILQPESNTFIAAAQGQAWTAAAFVALVAGTLDNVTLLTWGLRFNNGAGSSVSAGSVSSLGIGAQPARFSATLTADDPLTAFVNASLVANFTNSSAVDMTLRIINPQVSRGAVAGAPVATAGSAVAPCVAL